MRAALAEALSLVREGRPDEADARRPALTSLENLRLELAQTYRQGDVASARRLAEVLWRAAEVDATVASVLVEAAHPELAAPAAELLQRTLREATVELPPLWQRLAQGPGDLDAWGPLLAALIATDQDLVAVDGVARALAEGSGEFALWARLVELLLIYRRRIALLATVELGHLAFPEAPPMVATSVQIFLGLGELEVARTLLDGLRRPAVEHPLVSAARVAVAEARAAAAQLEPTSAP
jgi:hypothetical protein